MNSKNLWIAFVIWPFLGFILAWKQLKTQAGRRVILAFYVLFGLLYVINPEMDGARRAQMLEETHQQPFSQVTYYFDNYLTSTLDFLDPLIIYIVSRFTDYHGFLFAAYAFIFGWLSLRFIRILLCEFYFDKLNQTALLFLWLLVWVSSIFEIGGFRMWSAGWLFSLGALTYIVKSESRYLLLAALSVFMHFSYLPLVILLVLYHFIGNRIKVYSLLAIVTFFIGELDIQALRDYASIISPAHEQKVIAYTGEAYTEKKALGSVNAAWFMKVGPQGVFYFTILSLAFIIRKTKFRFYYDVLLIRLMSITLLLLSFSNLASLVPSGGRFRVIFYTFAFTVLAYYYNKFNANNRLSWFNFIGLGFGVLYILIKFRIGAETFNAMLLTPSVLMPLGFIEEITLKDLLF